MVAELRNLREAFGEIVVDQAQRAARAHDMRDRDRDRLRVSDAAQWYVGHANSDAKARERLDDAGMEFYYPLTRTFRAVPKKRLNHAKRSGPPIMEEVLRPLFRGYFFLRFDLRDGTWHDTFELAGISGMLANDRGGLPMPAPIAAGEIDKIKAREVDGAIPGNARARTVIPYALGEEVRIDDPTMARATGIVDGLHGQREWVPDMAVGELNDRVKLRLLVGMLGRMTVVVLPITSISKL